MGRKLSFVLLIAIISMQISACSDTAVKKSTSGEVVIPQPGKDKPRLTIFIAGNDPMRDSDFFTAYRKRFEKEYGVKVNYHVIGYVSGESGIVDYYGKLTARLHMENAPELVLYGPNNLSALIEQRAVVNVKGKIPNLEKVYDALLGNETYYVPVGMAYMGTALNKKVLGELNIGEPELDWTNQDYYTIRERWLAEAGRPFTRIEFYDTIDKYISSLNIFDRDNKKANINTQEMKGFIKSIRDEIYSGKYLLKRDYSYENYYNLLFDEQSKEYQDGTALLLSDEYLNSSLRNMEKEYFCNILVSENNDYMLKWDNLAVLPRFKDGNPYKPNLSTWGFLVNKYGKELELAYEFINGLLSDEVQMQMLDKPTGEFCYYPVSKAVEGEISGMENKKQLGKGAIELREYALNKVKAGEFSMDFYINGKEREMFSLVLKDISKYIFADKKYSDEELSKELESLEGKYNIWLNE
ncbi:MAG TPA: ABC transporter substrate-binding protein [Clostridia bacterium]|nr:ABC transporter substrate-binding protein [Clostridia bacterium]